MSEHEAHGTSFYVKIWGILLILLFVSIMGPELGIKWVTLVTAFGIAIVKAYMVAVNFMHINLTPRFVVYFVSTTLVFMLLFFAGTAPDVMKDQGTNWIKPAWIAAAVEYKEHGPTRAHGHAGGHADEGAHH